MTNIRFRSVVLPNVKGKVFMSAMPGRYEPFRDMLAGLAKYDIKHLVCLTSMSEITAISPVYVKAIRTKTLPCNLVHYPIPDYGVPTDQDEFLAVIHRMSRKLKDGENILVHCGAGIGRTATFALGVLLDLGFNLEQALRLVGEAGSQPEGNQAEFISGILHCFPQNGELSGDSDGRE